MTLRTANSTLAAATVTVVALATSGLGVVPAQAAGHAVSVSAISRSGEKMTVPASLVNLASGRRYQVNSGSSANVPAGRYAVGSYIVEFPVLTVAARTLEIGKNTSVVFDARQGRKVTVQVDDPKARPGPMAVVPFAGGKGKQATFISDNGLDNFRAAPATSTYVIPSPGSSEIRLGVHAILVGGGDPATVRYDLARSYNGLPSNPTIRTTRQKLARVDLDVATIDPDQSTFLGLTAEDPDGGQVVGTAVGVPALGRQVNYRTPGKWASRLVMNSQVYSTAILTDDEKTQKLEAGKTYPQSWGFGVWAPRSPSPAIYIADGTLQVGGGPPICAFDGRGVELDDCQLQNQEFSYKLYKGTSSGQLLGQGPSVSARVNDAKPQWYTVELLATRTSAPPGPGSLSTSVTSRWYFQAGGETRTKKRDATSEAGRS